MKTTSKVSINLISYVFLLMALLTFTAGMFVNHNYLKALCNENSFLYQPRLVFSILLIFIFGFMFIHTLNRQGKISSIWECIWSFPTGICLWVFSAEALLILGIHYSFINAVILLFTILAINYFINCKKEKTDHSSNYAGKLVKSYLPLFIIVIAFAFLVSAGFIYMIVNFDSFYYFENYGLALAKAGNYRHFVTEDSFVLTNIGQFLPLVKSYTAFWGIGNMFHIHVFAEINMLVAFAVYIYESISQKKALLYTLFFTLMLTTCSVFFMFTNWILSNAWLTFYLLFAFIICLKIICPGKDEIPSVYCILLSLFSLCITMLRKDGLILTCFLIVALAIYVKKEQLKKAALLKIVLPSIAYEIIYIVYINLILKATVVFAYRSSLVYKNYPLMLITCGVATILYLSILYIPFEKIFKDKLSYFVTGCMMLLFILLGLRNIGETIDYIDVWSRNFFGTAYGYCIFMILLLILIIIIKAKTYDFSLFYLCGYTLLIFVIYIFKGNKEVNIDNSGLRAIYQLTPIIFLLAAIALNPKENQEKN